MKEWSYSYHAISKADWLRQIEADLKGAPLDSLFTSFRKGELLDPFIHKDDLQGPVVRLPDGLFLHPPTLTEWITSAGLTPQEINQWIIQALTQDVQSIVLELTDTGPEFESGWLEGVYPDMILLQAEIRNSQDLHFSAMTTVLPTDTVFRINRTSMASFPSVFSNDTGETRMGYQVNNRFVYSIPQEGDPVELLQAVLQLVSSDLGVWIEAGLPATDYLQRCIFRINAPEPYILHLLLVRTFHLLWQNFYAWHTGQTLSKKVKYLELHILQKDEESQESFLIRASMSGLAASLSGTHFIVFRLTNGVSSSFMNRRTSRNVHHLLHLESTMFRGMDPLSGAYSLDYYTQRWAQEVWEKLKE